MPSNTHSADVIVVGGGLGGMCAAVVAARGGASVAVFEALEHIGGNAAVSTGYIAFADFSRQRQEGHRDSPEGYLEDLRAEFERESEHFGLYFDEDVARVYTERSNEAYDFLTSLGITFGRFIDRPLQHTTTRMLVLEDSSLFRSAFEKEFERLEISTVFETKVVKLLTDRGRVVGVRARLADGTLEDWTTRSAVILGTGGYQANPEMRQLFQPASQAHTPYYGVDSARGDGHMLGQAVGGQLVNMTYIPMFVRAPSAVVEDAIAVGQEGIRFHNEPGPYLQRVAALRQQEAQSGPCYYIYDHTTATKKARLFRHLPEAPLVAETLEQLAEQIGCPPSALVQTVKEWNALIQDPARKDPFDRTIFPVDRHGIIEHPFYAAKMIVGASFTAGGFRTSTTMEVTDLDGNPITGLLAVGDTVGAVNAANGLGGVHLGSASTFGIVAGERALAMLAAEDEAR